LIAEELATRLAATLTRKFCLRRPTTCALSNRQVRFLVSPPIAIGNVTFFGKKIGLSCGETLTDYLREICSRALKTTFSRIIIVNGCGGNNSHIAAVKKHSRKIIYLPRWWRIRDTRRIDSSFRRFLNEGGSASDWLGTHGGELETSALLAIDRKYGTKWVRRSKIARAKGPCSKSEVTGAKGHGELRNLTTSGVLGNASRASAQKGEKLFRTVVRFYAEQITFTVRREKT
jgi:creatinine amidohydrolase/Fe(II)-dependent formamide hydrolase-like protein